MDNLQALLDTPPDFRSGHIVMLGLPNTGKSTLFNALIGERLSITTPKPQTTRRSILGILTTKKAQMMFMDTPGLLAPAYRLQEMMEREIAAALEGADIVLGLVDASNFDETFDERVRKAFAETGLPLVIALNKIDLVGEDEVQRQSGIIRGVHGGATVFHVSATKATNVTDLRVHLESALPRGPRFYPHDTLTEHPERFFVEELIREEIFNRLRQELPYAIAVQVEEFREDGKKVYVQANVIVERDSQKGIVIGRGGKTLKAIGKSARGRIEGFLQHPVYLDLHVKVITNWRKKDTALRSLGYKP